MHYDCVDLIRNYPDRDGTEPQNGELWCELRIWMEQGSEIRMKKHGWVVCRLCLGMLTLLKSQQLILLSVMFDGM